MKIMHPSHLDDSALTAELARLAGMEREAGVALIVHLGEFDARRLYEGAGFSSTFTYCREVLNLSEDAIYNRIEAARAARRFPRILDMLAGGSLSMTTARLLGRRLTPENADALLGAASGKGKAQVEELLARWFPQADVPPTVRKLPAPAAAGPAREAGIPDLDSGSGVRPSISAPAQDASVAGGSQDRALLVTLASSDVTAPAAARRATVRPLAAERYEVRFTATAEMREKLRLAQDLLGHALPSGDLAQVFDRALTALLADLTRRKFAATARPREARPPADGSRGVPAAVRREVVARDGNRCAFVSKTAHRCGERRFLEFHHIVPYAAGGKPVTENITLRCRAHNGYEVDRFFGPGVRVGHGLVSRAALQASPDVRTRPGTSTRTRPRTSDTSGSRARTLPAT